MWLASTFNVVTYTAATSYVAGIFYDEQELRCKVTVYTQLVVGVDGTPHPIICFR